jgi:hypothetical protein
MKVFLNPFYRQYNIYFPKVKFFLIWPTRNKHFIAMSESCPNCEDRKNTLEQPGKLPALWQRGFFWMMVGLSFVCGGTLWLFLGHGSFIIRHRPAGFYVAIGGFVIYVMGRVLQVIQKSKQKKNTASEDFRQTE